MNEWLPRLSTGGGQGINSMEAKPKLKAPFPAFGGKSRVARLIWGRLGDVDNAIEPFANSAAWLLARPHPPRIETLNDADCYIANFWRATKYDPGQVAEFADGPVNEADLHARHRWLVLSDEAKEFRRRMRREPDYYDARVAGWWCWGICCWIGGGWCVEPAEETSQDKRPKLAGSSPGSIENGAGVHQAGPRGKRGPAGGTGDRSVLLGGGDHQHGHGIHAKRPQSARPDGDGTGGSMRGVHGNATQTRRPHLAGGKIQYGMGVHAKGESDNHRPQLADQGGGRCVTSSILEHGTCAQRRVWIMDWFSRLRDRLRTVRVCCGDWLRVCDSESVTTGLGVTGIFFDPPYGLGAGRDESIYAVDSLTVAGDVRNYCLERGDNPRMRICLAGYAGEGHEILEQHGWTVLEWKAQGGYGNRSEKGRENAKKERLWFSPHCRREATLFDSLTGATDHVDDEDEGPGPAESDFGREESGVVEPAPPLEERESIR